MKKRIITLLVAIFVIGCFPFSTVAALSAEDKPYFYDVQIDKEGEILGDGDTINVSCKLANCNIIVDDCICWINAYNSNIQFPLYYNEATGRYEGSYTFGETYDNPQRACYIMMIESYKNKITTYCNETTHPLGMHEFYYCNKCKDGIHYPVIDEAKGSTCIEEGMTEGLHCSLCITVIKVQETIPANGHTWDAGKVTTEPTEETTGVRTYACESCGETKTESIPTLDHVHKYIFTVTAPACTEKGYTTYACACGDSYIADEIPATGHVIEKGICTVCGIEDPDEADLFELYGTNMLLGNNLAMNFYIDPADLESGEDYYAVITKTYADRENLVIAINDGAWEEAYNMYRISLDKIAAKEMADEITVVLYNVKGEAVSKTWVDSVRDYTMRMLEKEEAKADPNEEQLALYVEMLNYGAAAQDHFEYNVNDLANNELTAAQKAYGLTDVEMEDSRVKGTGYMGTSLTLESNILMNFYFDSIPEEHDYVYAIATYTDHYGNAKQIRIEGKDFIRHNSSAWKIPVPGLVIADCRELVTVKVYETDGDVIASVADSIESYTARMDGDGSLYVAIMKFAVSAYNAFH